MTISSCVPYHLGEGNSASVRLKNLQRCKNGKNIVPSINGVGKNKPEIG